MRHGYPALLSALIILTGACSRGASTDAESAARAEIDALRTRYEQAIAAGDFTALGEVVAEDAIMVFPSGPAHDALRAAAGEAPLPVGATIEITPIEIEIMNARWAYEFGTSVVTYTPEGRAEPVVLRDTYLILFRNDGGGWRAYREVASANPPGPDWPAAQ